MKTTKLTDWNRNHLYHVEATGLCVEWAICMLGWECINDATDISPTEAAIIQHCEHAGADAPTYMRLPESQLMWYVVDAASTGHNGLMRFTPERFCEVFEMRDAAGTPNEPAWLELYRQFQQS